MKFSFRICFKEGFKRGFACTTGFKEVIMETIIFTKKPGSIGLPGFLFLEHLFKNYREIITNSVRRFSARPSSVALSATGRDSP